MQNIIFFPYHLHCLVIFKMNHDVSIFTLCLCFIHHIKCPLVYVRLVYNYSFFMIQLVKRQILTVYRMYLPTNLFFTYIHYYISKNLIALNHFLTSHVTLADPTRIFLFVNLNKLSNKMDVSTMSILLSQVLCFLLQIYHFAL